MKGDTTMLDNIFGKPSNKKVGNRGEELPADNYGYPDTHIPSGLCSRCNKQSSFEVIESIPISFTGTFYSGGRNAQPERSFDDQVSLLECRSCKQIMVVIEESYINETPKRIDMDKGGYMSFRGFFWWPMNNISQTDDVPKDIASAYNEGVTCLSASCPSAATVMFRRTLEAIAVDKGYNENTLHKSLIKMFDEGTLPTTFKEWVNELKNVGNAGAYFDPIEKVDVKDARDMQKFIEELINHIYIIPEQLRKRRLK